MLSSFTYSFISDDLDGTQRYFSTLAECMSAAWMDFADQCDASGEYGCQDVWYSELEIRNNDENLILNTNASYVRYDRAECVPVVPHNYTSEWRAIQ